MRSLPALRVLVVVAHLSAGTCFAQLTSQQALDAGKSAGATGRGQAYSSVNSATGAASMPGFGASAAETSYFSNGQGVLGPYGEQKKADCATWVPGADQMKNKECDAINALAKQTAPGGKPPISVTRGDPIMIQGRAVTNDPEAIIGTIAGAYSACTTKTVTTPGDFVLETCDDFMTASSANCSIGQIVQVDASYLYQCLEALNTQRSSSCFVPRVVVVTPTYHYQCAQTSERDAIYTCSKTAIVDVTDNGLSCSYGAFLTGFARIAYIRPATFVGAVCADDIRFTWFYTYSECDGTDAFQYVTTVMPSDDFQIMNVNLGCGGGYSLWGSCGGGNCSYGVGFVFDNFVCDQYDYSNPSCDDSGCSYPCLQGHDEPVYDAIAGFQWQRPVHTYTVTNSWDDQCAGLEARAQ